MQVKILAGVDLLGLGGEHLAAGDCPGLGVLVQQLAVLDAALAEMLGQDQIGVEEPFLVDQLGANASVLGAGRLGGFIANGGLGLGHGKSARLGGLGGQGGQQRGKQAGAGKDRQFCVHG